MGRPGHGLATPDSAAMVLKTVGNPGNYERASACAPTGCEQKSAGPDRRHDQRWSGPTVPKALPSTRGTTNTPPFAAKSTDRVRQGSFELWRTCAAPLLPPRWSYEIGSIPRSTQECRKSTRNLKRLVPLMTAFVRVFILVDFLARTILFSIYLVMFLLCQMAAVGLPVTTNLLLDVLFAALQIRTLTRR